jgi:hypothetical protein
MYRDGNFMGDADRPECSGSLPSAKRDRERFILKSQLATGYKLTGCMNLTSSGFINYFIFGGFCVYSDRQEKAGAETGFFYT